MSEVLEAASEGAFPPFPSGAAELRDQILRLNGVLRAAVERFRSTHTVEQHRGLDGVAVFDDEIDHFLNGAVVEDASSDDVAGEQERLRCELRTQAGASQDMDLPVESIRRRFGLGSVELDAFLLCVAAELHPGYGRVFAYLNNDLSRRRPTVALMVEILSTSWAERLEVRRALGPHTVLFRSGLLTATRAEVDHLNLELTVDPVVLEYVLGGEGPRNESGAGDEMEVEELLISPAEHDTIERTIGYLERAVPESFGTTVVVLSGAPGVGRRSVARAMCRRQGYRLRSTAKDASAASVMAGLPQWLRDARLADQVPAIYVPREAGEDAAGLQPFIDGAVAARCGLAFLLVDSDQPPRLGGSDTASLVGVHLSPPSGRIRSAAWKRALSKHGLDCSEETISTIAAVYPFNVGRIHATVQDAELRSRVADAEQGHLGMGTLAQACRQQTHHQLDRLAQPLPVRHGWNDLVLPPDELRRLKEIANAVRNRDQVMGEWGFNERVSAGPGVNAIFFGPSGTGKTMAASILAGDLGMAIYRVDLSRVMSKYIGETERNLDALFNEARHSFALLFFDEAEAIFGKRSEVKDAHDRYANIEVAYLLQRMEAFEGVAILATNLRKNMDNAFLRRLQFAVEFPLPTVTERLRIWRQVWPAPAQMGHDVDLEFMAKHVELSGGHIRNIALMAAYLATQDRTAIGMAHLVAATRREFQKLGWRNAPEQFNVYAPLLEPGLKR
jgi:hypothetical protein